MKLISLNPMMPQSLIKDNVIETNQLTTTKNGFFEKLAQN